VLRKVKQGEHCLTPATICKNLSLVETGIFRSYYLIDDREVNVNFFVPGSFATSVDSFVHQVPARCHIQALEDATLVCIHYNDLHHLYSRFPKLLEFSRRMNEQMLIESQQRTESFILNTVKERYLNFMKSFKELHNKVPLYHIATYLGIEGPSLSRIRKEISLTSI